jgi:hypothetical protein
MNSENHHLVHANVALARGPLDSEVMREFVEQVDEINGVAHLSPGFICQPTPPDIGTIFKGDFLLNVSVWESIETLRAFSCSGKHAEALDNYILFWYPAGEVPTEIEIKRRIDYLAAHGATPYGFNFEQSFSNCEAKNYIPGI